MTSPERWKPITCEDGRYMISSHGRVQNVQTGRILKPYVGDKAGHLRVDLTNSRHYVHVLVAEAFIGPRPPGQEVCHGDNNPTNNYVENLRWDTRSQNVIDLRADKTKCKHGHPWEEWNIYTDPNGWQACRGCRRIARRNNKMKGVPNAAH